MVVSHQIHSYIIPSKKAYIPSKKTYIHSPSHHKNSGSNHQASKEKIITTSAPCLGVRAPVMGPSRWAVVKVMSSLLQADESANKLFTHICLYACIYHICMHMFMQRIHTAYLIMQLYTHTYIYV